jgi:uncharacterized protein
MDVFAPLQWFADLITYRVFALRGGTRLASSVDFFLYDVPKILLLLVTVIFVITIVRSFFPAERTRRLLSGSRLYGGNVAAALLGVVTPFCSCSAVPLFIGFVEGGVPLGVTFSFLISSPMVNEVALVLLLGLFGWKVAGIYVGAGLAVAIASGIVIGKLGLEGQVEEYVYAMKVGESVAERQDWPGRLAYARDYMLDIVGKVWLYVVGAVAIGAAIHGYVPAGFLATYAGPGNPLAVPLAVLVGVPLYSNAAGVIPIVSSLIEKGIPLGTALAFMMAVTALSFPELVILRRVLKPKLIAVFVGVNTVAIIGIGYLFNWVMG